MNNFCDGHYFKNYHKFKETRTILDALVLTNYLQWNQTCTKFFEIGVYKGANFAIAVEAKDNMECLLVDPNFTFFDKLWTKVKIKLSKNSAPWLPPSITILILSMKLYFVFFLYK